MKSTYKSVTCIGPALAQERAVRIAQALLLAGLAAASLVTEAQTTLADRPLFSTLGVPGNLGLLLSVEFPTAISVAHTNRTYANTSTYLGYFDPDKCYDYRYTDGTSTDNYFEPKASAAANHICVNKWSGNFLNWASMQTIDPFRWVLTGGSRVIDTASLTVLEKAWGTVQGSTSNFPDSTLASGSLAGATPFPASAGTLYMRIWGQGNKMRFGIPDASAGINFTARFWNNTTRAGGSVLTRTDSTIDYDWGGGSPGAGVNNDNFSAEWTANVTVPTTGNYRFRLKADDTAQLRVNGVLQINQTSYQNMAYQTSANIALVAGNTVTINAVMSEGGGGAGMQLQWQRPGDPDFTTMGTSLPAMNSATATHYNNSVASVTGAATYEVFVRAKVCDSGAPGGVEKNCVAYGTNYKPEGLIQGYANKIRYSAFGYLNDSNVLRDGGVLRARQKFVGPTKPVPGSTAVTNANREWDSTTGVFITNPDTTDATATNTLFGTAVANSGVINYLNKFGQITPGSYKSYDNVSELYYAAIRYFKNLGNVPEWTNMTGASDPTKATWADGFPVITDWSTTAGDAKDPILYSCQKNFVLGIGDANTHADKNVPGNTATANEPAMPSAVSADTSVNAVTATNKIGELEGLGSSLGTTNPINGCCTNNSALMAGLAYDAHTRDMRPSDPKHINGTYKPQTLDTYWVDVQEYQAYKNNNQFYMATKYGGFDFPKDTKYDASTKRYTLPDGTIFDPYTRTTALPQAWWHKNSDTFGANYRPDQYFSGGRPDLMKAGLEEVFSSIDAKGDTNTTSFSSALPQLALSGNKSYASLYDAKAWTGEVNGSALSFDAATGEPTLAKQWSFTDTLAAKLAGTGWSATTALARRVVTWNGTTGIPFRASTTAVTGTQLAALNTSYVAGDDSSNYLNYLRGDRSKEQDPTIVDAARVYRYRSKLVGDIVGSKARPVGPPSFPFSDSTNPGYSSFKSTWASRPTVVYVGANDGMLHAIHGDMTGSNAGNELFAYVPSALFQGPNGTPNVDGLASLGNPNFTHHYLVNASPNVYDVDFGRVPDATGAKQTGTADWHSVLIGGLGKGGKSYYAIDVTDPVGASTAGESGVAGKVLWEFTNADLGYTFGDPVVVKTKKYGWVVVLVSGYNNADGEGYFFIVNPKTGALLEKISTGSVPTGATAGMAHANAFVIDSTDGTTDAVYAADLLGRLWRWDLTLASGTYPAPLQMASLTDSGGTAQPVTSRPLIEVHPKSKKRYVMLGTGQLLDDTDISSTQVQTYYMIIDGTNAKFNAIGDLPTASPAVTFPITRSNLTANSAPLNGIVTVDPTKPMGWYEDLGAGTGGIARRVIADSSTLGGSVAFSALLPKNDDPCSQSGASTIYGRDFASAKTTLVETGTSTPKESVDAGGNVTDLRNLSVDGKGRLISCTDTGNCKNVDTSTPAGLTVRRLNWRELQVVD
jgi:type IV pilus assembly protein PilY1